MSEVLISSVMVVCFSSYELHVFPPGHVSNEQIKKLVSKETMVFKTSAFDFLCNGQFTLSTVLINANIWCTIAVTCFFVCDNV